MQSYIALHKIMQEPDEMQWYFGIQIWWYIFQATDPDVAATAHEEASNVDSYSAQQTASDVDPYAAYNAYYAAYGNQAQSSGQYITEKQSYGDQVKEFMGPDAPVRWFGPQ